MFRAALALFAAAFVTAANASVGDLFVDVDTVPVWEMCAGLQNGTQLLCADNGRVALFESVTTSTFPVIFDVAEFTATTYDVAALNRNFVLVGHGAVLYHVNWETRAVRAVEGGLAFSRRFERLSDTLVAIFAHDRLILATEHPYQPGVYVRALVRQGRHAGVALAGSERIVFFTGTASLRMERWRYAVSPVNGQIVLLQEEPLAFTAERRFSLGANFPAPIALKTNVSAAHGGRNISWMYVQSYTREWRWYPVREPSWPDIGSPSCPKTQFTFSTATGDF